MGNIFIFQTRRIGDFFQSIPLLETLSCGGEKNVDILISESTSDVKNIFKGNINFFTYESLFNRFGSKLTYNIPGSIKNLKFFISDFSKKYETAVNLNYDITNSLFVGLFKNQKKGFIAKCKSTKNSEIISRSSAAGYLFNIVKNRRFNRINIVDIYSLIGSGYPAEIKPRYAVLNLIKNNSDCLKPLRICISTGATSVKRVWYSGSYAALISLLADNLNCEIILVGTAEETAAAAEIKEKIPKNINILDLTGKTSLYELIYLIKDFDLIISPDTGTLHIAQIFNVPSVSIFTGNAFFYETGPHTEDSLVIHSNADCYPCLQQEPCMFNYACKDDIKPEDVFNLAMFQVKKDKSYLKAIKKGNFSVSICKRLDSVHFYPLMKTEINKPELAAEILKFSWINVLSKGKTKINLNIILKYTKKYYNISKTDVNSLTGELYFVKTLFENGKVAFAGLQVGGDPDAYYFDKFKDSVKSIGENYNYLKLACDYFLDEINYSAALNGFDDLILLLDNAVSILKAFI